MCAQPVSLKNLANPPQHHVLPHPDDNRIEVLFLTGQPGAGKTAVAKELGELLRQSHEPHAIIDLDELCRGVLPNGTPNFNRSLIYRCQSYGGLGKFLCCWSSETDHGTHH